MGTILLFIIVLSLLVFVHELGHFVMARKMGMKVDEFGFGFPPRLFGVKRGGTIYSINWIPLGGFVRIKGESGAHVGDQDSFAAKKAWQRFVVLIAGVVMNLVLAAVLFSVGFMVGMPSAIHDELPASAHIEEQTLTIVQVLEDSPAVEAGIQAGDELVSIDGEVFTSELEARNYLAEQSAMGVTLELVSETGGQRSVEVTGRDLPETDAPAIGIGFVATGLVSYPFFQAIGQGFATTGIYTVEIVKAFGGIIRDLFVSQEVGVDLSGPVGIAVMTGQVAAMGLVYLLQFTAVLSINLAVINALPVPALDGGRILFLIIEKLRGGKPVDERVEAIVHNLGFVLLMLLVVLVTYKDIVSFL